MALSFYSGMVQVIRGNKWGVTEVGQRSLQEGMVRWRSRFAVRWACFCWICDETFRSDIEYVTMMVWVLREDVLPPSCLT